MEGPVGLAFVDESPKVPGNAPYGIPVLVLYLTNLQAKAPHKTGH